MSERFYFCTFHFCLLFPNHRIESSQPGKSFYMQTEKFLIKNYSISEKFLVWNGFRQFHWIVPPNSQIWHSRNGWLIEENTNFVSILSNKSILFLDFGWKSDETQNFWLPFYFLFTLKTIVGISSRQTHWPDPPDDSLPPLSLAYFWRR